MAISLQLFMLGGTGYLLEAMMSRIDIKADQKFLIMGPITRVEKYY